VRKLFIFIFIAIGLKAFAQDPSSVKMEYDESKDVSKNYAKSRTAIKLNPLLFFRGDVPIYVERNITDKFSLEAGVGFTMVDYLSDLSFEPAVSEREMEIGLSYRAGVRYYAADFSFEPEGVYFSAEYRYQNYKFNYMDLSHSYSNSDIRLTMGYLSNIEEHVFIEPYAGFGFRNRTFKYPSSLNYDVKDGLVPFLSLGFKMGISF